MFWGVTVGHTHLCLNSMDKCEQVGCSHKQQNVPWIGQHKQACLCFLREPTAVSLLFCIPSCSEQLLLQTCWTVTCAFECKAHCGMFKLLKNCYLIYSHKNVVKQQSSFPLGEVNNPDASHLLTLKLCGCGHLHRDDKILEKTSTIHLDTCLTRNT